MKIVRQTQFSEYKVLNYWKHLQAILRAHYDYPPVTIELDPTNACNFQCFFCNDQRKLSHTQMLPYPIIVKLLVDASKMGVKSIVIKGGGEPLCYPHFDEVMKDIREEGMRAGLITNFSIISEERLRTISQTCDWIRVSLDAGTDETYKRVKGTTYSFTKVLEDLGKLRRMAPNLIIGANYVINQYNSRELVLATEMIKEIGLNYINIRPPFLHEIDMPEREWEKVDMEIRRARRLADDRFLVFTKYRPTEYGNYYIQKGFSRCLATPLVASVEASGEVCICCSLKGFREFSFGNINERSFEMIWHSEKRKELLRKLRRGIPSICQQFCSDRLDRYNRLLNYLDSEDKLHVEFL